MNKLNTTGFDAPSARRQQQARRGGLMRLAQRLVQTLWTRPVTRQLPEAERLAALQHFLANEFEGCWAHMSARDRQLYRVLMRSSSLASLQRMRFECFHLMCRLLGEGAARSRLQQIDGWLLARH